MAKIELSVGELAFRPLIERLRDTQANIDELAHGQADAVIDPDTGTAMLLGVAQGALLDRQRRYASLYEFVACGVVVCDRFGIVEYANSVFCSSVGEPLSELAGKRWADVIECATDFDGVPLETDELPDQTVLRDRESVRNSLVRISLGGADDKFFVAHAKRLTSPMTGETIGSVMSWVDVTDMRASEQGRVDAAALEERQRISRDLHDSLSNRLAAMNVQIHGLTRRAAESSTEDIVLELERLRMQVQESINDARSAVSSLSEPGAEDQSLASSLQEMLESQVAGAGPELRVKVEGSPRPVGYTVATTCLRIAQEATGNAVKHANASEIHATLRFLPAGIEVSISDDGTGFDPDVPRQSGSQSGFGMANMRRRAEDARGQLVVQSGPEGTTVTLSVPV